MVLNINNGKEYYETVFRIGNKGKGVKLKTLKNFY